MTRRPAICAAAQDENAGRFCAFEDDDRQTHSPERLTKLLRCQRYQGDPLHIGSLPLPLRDPLLLRRTQLLPLRGGIVGNRR
jgi:hypothetical protein